MHKVAGLANSPGRLLDMPSRRHHRLSLLQKYMGAEGARLADKDRADHQAESLQPGTQSHDDKLQHVIDHLSPDSESEEREELPLLEDRLGETKSKEEAVKFSKLPARPHPSAPNKPPFETIIVGHLTAPLDRLKDCFAAFRTE